jgi:hypothetical protein
MIKSDLKFLQLCFKLLQVLQMMHRLLSLDFWKKHHSQDPDQNNSKM